MFSLLYTEGYNKPSHAQYSVLPTCIVIALLLNQARAGSRPVRAWFLDIVPVWTSVCVFVCVCVCVCLPPRLLITCGVIWTPYDWLNKFYSRYMAIVVVIINGRGLGIDTCYRH